MTRTSVLLLAFVFCAAAKDLRLPNRDDSVRFAVIGDQGTGSRQQYQVAQQMAAWRERFPFSFVIVLGDNLYGGENPSDFARKFEEPYEGLLADGVKFYASLGNHDDTNQRFYKLFNMNGERWYSFQPKEGVRFIALDSNYMGRDQIEWLEKQLSSKSDWKICFFHHPLYSSGKAHGPAVELRSALEPLFTRYAVSVVFSGHEHFYERLKPQKGIHYFIMGSSGKIRKGNIRATDETAVGYDRDNAFMLVEIDGDRMYFQTIGRTGSTIDSGVIPRTQHMSAAFK